MAWLTTPQIVISSLEIVFFFGDRSAVAASSSGKERENMSRCTRAEAVGMSDREGMAHMIKVRSAVLKIQVE